jgi:hypothetical protein
MSTFLVDAQTLLALRERLGQLHGQLLGMPIVLRGFDGLLGGRGVEGELEAFSLRWEADIQGVGGQLTRLMHQLVAAADAYQHIDDGLGGAAHRRAAAHRLAHRPSSGSGTTTVPRPHSRRAEPPRRHGHPGVGSGTTVIDPGAGSGRTVVGPPAATHSPTHGSGTTTVGPGAPAVSPPPGPGPAHQPSTGSGTTTIDPGATAPSHQPASGSGATVVGAAVAVSGSRSSGADEPEPGS